MAITFPSTANDKTATTYANRINTPIDKPANAATGDVLIATIRPEASVSSTLEPPSGWTLIASVRRETPNDFWNFTAYRILQAGDPASWNWSHLLTPTMGWCIRATGTFSGDILDPATANTATNTGVPVHSVPGITTTADNVGVVLTVASWSGNSYSATTLVEIQDAGAGVTCAAVQATAGASGTESATADVTTDYCGILFGIKEAGGAAVVEGSAALAALGTLGATALIQQEAAAAFPAVTSLTAAGFVEQHASATFPAMMTLAATGQVITAGVVQGSATLAMTGTLAGAAMVEVQAGATLPAVAVLDATGLMEVFGSALLQMTTMMIANVLPPPVIAQPSTVLVISGRHRAIIDAKANAAEAATGRHRVEVQ